MSSHAVFHERLPNQARGKFYVDAQCLDCDLCREIAPGIFVRDAEHGVAIVTRQPVTPNEFKLCAEAVDGCPCEAIGDDGEQHDWDSIPPYQWSENKESQPEPRQCRCHDKQDNSNESRNA